MDDKKKQQSRSLGSIGRGYTPPTPGSVNDRDWTVGGFNARTNVSNGEIVKNTGSHPRLPDGAGFIGSSSTHNPIVPNPNQAAPPPPAPVANPFVDSMTGAMPFPYFVHRLEYEALRSRVVGGPLSVIVVSITGYRNLGLDVGALALDSAITELAKVVFANMRALDLVGVYGEGKFIIACPHTDSAAAKALCGALATGVTAIRLTSKWKEFGIGINSGISVIGEEIFDAESLIALADLGAEMAEANDAAWHCEQDP